MSKDFAYTNNSLCLNRKGSVTILALVVMVFLGIVIAGILPMISNETKIVAMNRDVIEAQYAAEAGVKRAIVAFNEKSTNWVWIGQDKAFTNVAVAIKKYNVTIAPAMTNGSQPAAGTYVVTSVGTVNGAVKRSTATIDVSAGGLSSFNGFAVYGGTSVAFAKDSLVTGSIGSGGSIAGKPQVTDGQTLPSSPIATVDTTAEQQIFLNQFKDTTAPEPDANGGTLNLGHYYIDGDWNITKDTTFTAASGQTPIIYIKGDVNVSKDFFLNGPIMIVVEGSIRVAKDLNANNVVFVVGGTADFQKDSTIIGAVIGFGEVDFRKDATVTYDQTTVAAFTTASTSTTVSKWKNY